MTADVGFFAWLTICLGLAFAGGLTAKLLRQSPILGYLVAGVVLNEVSVYYSLPTAFIGTLSEIGLALLMFTLGLELSFDRLRRMGWLVVGGAVVQMMAFISLGLFWLPAYGFTVNGVIFMAAGFSLSSTAVVMKMLADRGEENTLEGEIMLGWLLVQDLAVLPMVALLPLLKGDGAGDVWRAMALALGLLLVIVLLGRTAVHWLMDRVARLGMKELLLVAAAGFCLLVGILTSLVGLSFSLGAFIAGVILAKSNEKQAVFAEVRPLRDFFSVLFFVLLGMMLRTDFLFNNFGLVLGVSLVVMAVKIILVSGLLYVFGMHLKTMTSVGAGLSQVGEFAVILAGLGVAEGLLDASVFSLILAVVMTTIFLTPFLFLARQFIYDCLCAWLKNMWPDYYRHRFSVYRKNRKKGLAICDHAVVCGYGRVGSWVGRALSRANLPYVVVDLNFDTVAKLKKEGIEAVYGDSADIEMLDYVQVDKARVVVVAIPDLSEQMLIVANCRRLNPEVKVISRVHHHEDWLKLKELGGQVVVQPEMEAALSIIRHVWRYFDLTGREASRSLGELRREMSS